MANFGECYLLVRNMKLTQNKAERVSERCLTPHKPGGVDDLGGAVDVPTPYPRRCGTK